MKKTTKIILFSSSFLFFGCSTENVKNERTDLNSSKKEQPPIDSVEKVQTEDFENFNKKFHSDKNFQMSRIKFPIKGELITTEESITKWTEKNWQFVNRQVTLGEWKDNGLEHKLIKTENEVFEKIWVENAGFSLERKFQLIENKWYLVMYKEVSV